MPKSSPADRLDDVLRAATRVFARKGFRRTQMTDVATDLGVSVGSLYTIVESKDALFHECLLAATPATVARRRLTFPLPTPPPRATKRVVEDGMAAVRRGSLLASAAEVDEPTDVAGALAAIIG